MQASNMYKSVVVLCVFFTAVSWGLPSRIVNGTDAHPGEIPYIVSLHYLDGKHICGGSILDATHILTAAHCVYGIIRDLFITYGTLDVYDMKTSIKVATRVYHQDFKEGGGYFHDVAVLTLEEAIQFSDNVNAIVLPEQGEPTPEYATSVLAGWGLDSTGGEVQRYLQRVDLSVYPDADCERLLHYIPNRKYNLCAGVEAGGKGQCSGDSGGPLYSNGKQVGIVSWSVKPCADPGHPGVFTKVSSYIDWIRNQITN